DGNRGLVGPLFLPPYTACFNDYSTLVAATTPSSAMALAYRRRTRLRTDSRFFPGLPVYADIVAGHASLAGIHFLLRDTSFAIGPITTVMLQRPDVLDLSMQAASCQHASLGTLIKDVTVRAGIPDDQPIPASGKGADPLRPVLGALGEMAERLLAVLHTAAAE